MPAKKPWPGPGVAATVASSSRPGPRLFFAGLVFLTLLPQVAPQQQAQWTALIENIARSSLLNTAPGTTLERDVQALISFFNNTCTAAVDDSRDTANPYRGAFSLVSQWRQQRGWQSIVRAHSNVAVQCRALYMEGGVEFASKHCFWNIQSLCTNADKECEDAGLNGTVFPSPRWTIVEDCCEQLERPVSACFELP